MKGRISVWYNYLLVCNLRWMRLEKGIITLNNLKQQCDQAQDSGDELLLLMIKVQNHRHQSNLVECDYLSWKIGKGKFKIPDIRTALVIPVDFTGYKTDLRIDVGVQYVEYFPVS